MQTYPDPDHNAPVMIVISRIGLGSSAGETASGDGLRGGGAGLDLFEAAAAELRAETAARAEALRANCVEASS